MKTYFIFGLFLFFSVPPFFFLNLWRLELKKKKQRQRIEKILNLSAATAEKKIRKPLHWSAPPDVVLLTFLFAFPLLLFFLGLSLSASAAITLGLLLCWRVVTKILKNHHLNTLSEALPSSMDFLGRSISSGSSFFSAIEQIAQANLPASREFKPIYEALSVGKPFAETLKKAAIKVNHPDFSLCMAVLIIQQETGSHDIKALNYLSALLRQKITLRNKIKASSAEAKLSGYLIAILPLLCFLVMGLFGSSYLAPALTSKIGQYLFFIAACSNIVGLIVMKKMTQINI